MEITEPVQVYLLEKDGGRGDRNIKGSNRSEISVIVPILWLAYYIRR